MQKKIYQRMFINGYSRWFRTWRRIRWSSPKTGSIFIVLLLLLQSECEADKNDKEPLITDFSDTLFMISPILTLTIKPRTRVYKSLITKTKLFKNIEITNINFNEFILRISYCHVIPNNTPKFQPSCSYDNYCNRQII